MREQKDLDLNEIVRNMEQTLIRLVGENIEIHTALDPALRRIVGDTGSLQQVIMNLAANARDAMPDGGKLTIKTENRSLDEAGAGEFSEGRSGDFIRLSVTDSGVGISADVVKRITEPFFTTKPAGQGKGLGLSVVYGIAKQHDGWLAVESKAGQGATLDVYLPAVQKKVAEKPTPIETGGKTRGSGERVLIVAGNPSELMLATRALWKNGYRVTNVGSAERAMEYCARKEESLDLVFCDIRLPGKKKVQFVEELLRRRPNLAVLVCSDPNAGKAELSQLRDKGPYRAPELLRRVREALRSAQPERKSSSPGRREERSA
jgi:CheY-like chemotaxis protein